MCRAIHSSAQCAGVLLKPILRTWPGAIGSIGQCSVVLHKTLLRKTTLTSQFIWVLFKPILLEATGSDIKYVYVLGELDGYEKLIW